MSLLIQLFNNLIFYRSQPQFVKFINNQILANKQSAIMIPVLKSLPQYQIQMHEDDNYPFNGPKSERYRTNVKLSVPFCKIHDNHEGVSRIISVDSQNVIKIYKVTQSNLHKSYTFIYEYIPYKFTYACPQIHEFVKNKSYKHVLFQLIKEIVQKGVKPNIQIQNFGFTLDFKLKMFINPNCQILNLAQQNQIQKTIYHYVTQCQRLFQHRQISNLNMKLKSKLTDLSQKIKKLNQGILLKDLKKRQKKQSQSAKNSSDNSDSLARTGSNEKIGNGQWHFDHDFNFQDCYSQRQARKQKKRRSSSFKHDQKPKSQSKQKKASWGQERSSMIESDKVTVLKKRISEALFKTQKALTKYEKIRSRSSKKKNHNLI